MESPKIKTPIREVFATVRESLSFAWQKERSLFLKNIILSIITALLIYLQLSSFAYIVDEIILIKQTGSSITQNLIYQALLLVVSFLVPSLLNALHAKYNHILRTKIITHLNNHMIGKFSKLDIATVEGSKFQSMLAFANEWGLGSVPNVIFTFMSTVRDVTTLAIAGVILYLINPILILIVLIGSIPGYIVQHKFGLKIFRIYNEQTDDKRILSDRKSYFMTPSMMVEVLLFGISSMFGKQIAGLRHNNDQEIIEVSSKKATMSFFVEFFSVTCLLVAVFIITRDGILGVMAIGSLLLAFSSYRSFDSTTESFFFHISQIQEHARYAKRWFDVFKIKAQITSKENALKPHWKVPPVIEFRNVYFSYPDSENLILKNISFIIESGEKVALVGQNGAGKTTTIKLLARVYDPTEGHIFIDGVDLKEIDIDHWREYLGVLFQDFNDYHMTVAEAIAIGRVQKSIDMHKVEWAARLAGADEFIQAFPKKYEQIVWKGFQDGVELSKGQHQRLAVARILYRDALVSILDEPTASIDAVVEEQIFEALETKMEGKTIVLISHRFSTVKNADKIMVVEHGEIKEIGNHSELMKKQGRYSELYTMQAKRYLEEIE